MLRTALLAIALLLTGCGGDSSGEPKGPKAACARLISIKGTGSFSLNKDSGTVYHYSPEFGKCFGLSTGVNYLTGEMAVRLSTWGAGKGDLDMVALCDVNADVCRIDTNVGNTAVSTGKEVSPSDFVTYVVRRMGSDTPEAFLHFCSPSEARGRSLSSVEEAVAP